MTTTRRGLAAFALAVSALSMTACTANEVPASVQSPAAPTSTAPSPSDAPTTAAPTEGPHGPTAAQLGIPVPTGKVHAAMASALFISDPVEGDSPLTLQTAAGKVNLAKHTGKLDVTSVPADPTWPQDTIVLDNYDYTIAGILGTPAPANPPVNADDAASDWDIATGLRDLHLEPAPSQTGKRWTSHAELPWGGTQDRTLDVDEDGAWTYTTVDHVEGSVYVRMLVLDPDHAYLPPVQDVQRILHADPIYKKHAK